MRIIKSSLEQKHIVPNFFPCLTHDRIMSKSACVCVCVSFCSRTCIIKIPYYTVFIIHCVHNLKSTSKIQKKERRFIIIVCRRLNKYFHYFLFTLKRLLFYPSSLALFLLIFNKYLLIIQN